MTDNPTEILRAAGAECAEVDILFFALESEESPRVPVEVVTQAILALARLAADGAKYKWQRDKAAERLGMDSGREMDTPEKTARQIAFLDRLWEEHDA
jgi:hypothetical protein